MRTPAKIFCLVLCLMFMLTKWAKLSEAVVQAQSGEPSSSKKEEKKEKAKSKGKKDSDKQGDESEAKVTEHTTTINGQELAYTATAREMVMKNDDGKVKARVFFVAYTKKEASDLAQRPVTFCFNGGPGSSSVWLHLGLLGPKRVRLPDDATMSRPPHRVEANPFSLLDVTDLVFIDPVTTGFSRPAQGEKKSQFHGYHEDLSSVGQFIHDYTSEYGRWASPKFLVGESYGGLRAAGLSGTLQNRYYMYLNGIVLVSAVVDYRTISFGRDNDLAYAMFLPAYTATAWYHKALPEALQQQPLEQVVKQAEQFALETYLPALSQGDALPAEERDAVAARLAWLTGLSKQYVERSNLRVPMHRFGKELLRDRQRIVGRFDSRYAGPDRDQVNDTSSYDPSGTAVFGPFTSAINDYLFHQLDYRNERVYEILTRKVHPWSYDGFENNYVSASETLRQAMTANPHLKVYAACGYYDLATPAFAMQYTRDHLRLDASLRENFSIGFYEGGHMMYVHEPSLKKLRSDLVKFYRTTLEQ